MKSFFKLNMLVLSFTTLFFVGCDKTDPYPVNFPEPRVHFLGTPIQSVQILAAGQAAYDVTIGSTDVASSDRIVTYTVSSTTGAVGGTNFTIATGNNSGVVTIPAGGTMAKIPVQGIFAPYNATGRKDTLLISLKEPSIKPMRPDTIRLVLRGTCFEGDVEYAALRGVYARTIEKFGTGAPYGPYRTTITAASAITPTTGVITVANIYDFGWGPIRFNIDYTNPALRTVTAIADNAISGSNAGDFNPQFNGRLIAVRQFPGDLGTFSACSNTLTLKMQLGVSDGAGGVSGYFPDLFLVTMQR